MPTIRLAGPAGTWPGSVIPALTGLPAPDWDSLVTTLMTLHDQQRETSLDARRGYRPRLAAPGAGHRPVLTFAGRLLDQAGHAIQPGPHQLTSLDDLTSFASAQASRHRQRSRQRGDDQRAAAELPARSLAAELYTEDSRHASTTWLG
jgi:hypothetical protein